MKLTAEEKKHIRLTKAGAVEQLKQGGLKPADARRLRRIIRTADELLTPIKEKK